MQLPKKGNRPVGDSKRWRDEVYKSSHYTRFCVICGIVTIHEVRDTDSICYKCNTIYNKKGNKLLTRAEIKEVSK